LQSPLLARISACQRQFHQSRNPPPHRAPTASRRTFG